MKFSARVLHDLHDAGVRCCVRRVARLMRQAKLRSLRARSTRICDAGRPPMSR
ncbi:IS3 family transposase [Paucibacter sp. TC2R-5]|uniref:IS3 family transposase n=1 Tax=Paucibacter sp. TC2R-5 TaxID=2893555 RepID=UPI0039DF506E